LQQLAFDGSTRTFRWDLGLLTFSRQSTIAK